MAPYSSPLSHSSGSFSSLLHGFSTGLHFSGSFSDVERTDFGGVWNFLFLVGLADSWFGVMMVAFVGCGWAQIFDEIEQ
jgi:hypothetical protein